jgi:hypothetical protein
MARSLPVPTVDGQCGGALRAGPPVVRRRAVLAGTVMTNVTAREAPEQGTKWKSHPYSLQHP